MFFCIIIGIPVYRTQIQQVKKLWGIMWYAHTRILPGFCRHAKSLIWQSMWNLGIDEWLVRVIQVMYMDVASKLKICDECNTEFSRNSSPKTGSQPSLVYHTPAGHKRNSKLAIPGNSSMVMTLCLKHIVTPKGSLSWILLLWPGGL